MEVLIAHGIEVAVDSDDGFTPTPAISHAILTHNAQSGPRADGIVITPSHNPPEDGGFKYNPPHGGPADTGVTKQIQDTANELLRDGLKGVRRHGYDEAIESARRYDYRSAYVDDLGAVVALDEIAQAGLKLGADPLGGASLAYWQVIGSQYGLDLEVVNDRVDPTFSFMPLDHDGKIRMDSSSPQAMAGLIALKDRFDIAFANDPDADRHGIVTRGGGLMNPNHYLAASIAYLLGGARGEWPADAGVGKTMVSSSIIDRVVVGAGHRLEEVPVGFKWFVSGLLDGSPRVRRRGERGRELSSPRRRRMEHGQGRPDHVPARGRDDRPHRQGSGSAIRRADRAIWKAAVPPNRHAGEPGAEVAPGQPFTRRSGSDGARGRADRPGAHRRAVGRAAGRCKGRGSQRLVRRAPLGTEDVLKLYAESFDSEQHLERILEQAQELLGQ